MAISCAGKDVEKLELSYTSARNASILEINLMGSWEAKHTVVQSRYITMNRKLACPRKIVLKYL